MTNPNKLADALKLIARMRAAIRGSYFTTGRGEHVSLPHQVDPSKLAALDKEATAFLAEHDAQPAPAPVQVDDVCPRCSSAWEPSPVSMPGGAMDRCSNADCRNMRWSRPRGFTAAHPPAPAADGAGELPLTYNLILKAVNDSSPRWGDQHDNPLAHKLSMREREWISGRVFAAIAALRQPVPDAVRESLPKSIVDEAKRLLHWVAQGNADCSRWAGDADQLMGRIIALASQQESRND